MTCVKYGAICKIYKEQTCKRANVMILNLDLQI